MRTTHYGSAFGERWTYYINGAKVEAPLDWADVVFEFARNKESDGVVMMPSIPVKFGGEGARIIREYVYNGYSGGLTLKIYHVTLQSRVDTYFTGSLSVESFVDNVDSVEIQAEDASLENLVNSKANVTYEIPFTAARRVEWPGGRVTLDYEAASEEGQTRYKVPPGAQDEAVRNMALPVEVVKKGDPFLFDPAAPDVLEAKQEVSLRLTVTGNLSAGAPRVTAEGNAALSGAVGGNPQITLVVYGTDGKEKLAEKVDAASSTYLTLPLTRGDLVTVEVRGTTFAAQGGSEGDNYLVFTWPKADASKPLVSVACSSTEEVRGIFAALSARDAFTALLATLADGLDYTLTYQDGLWLENYALFTTAAIAGAESGVIKASFNDFRDFFALLGIGVAFDELDGKPRCYVAYNTRTDETEALWPTGPSALIADVGDGWQDLSLQFNEEALFGAIEIGWDGVEDYEIIPYLSDPCGKSTYVNGQNSTSTVKQMLSTWRADALGIADLVLQAGLNGADSVKGDDIWVLACTQGLLAEFAPSQGENVLPGFSNIYNLRLRPTALMGYIKPFLAVPLALFPDVEGVATKVYKWVSSSNAATLRLGGKADNVSIDVGKVPPIHYPVYAAFSSSVRANLWQIMKDPALRYGYLTFTYRGVTLKGFIRSLQYNPTEESSQRCELYFTPDSQLYKLAK